MSAEIEYSKDIAKPPKHLNVEFFENVLENALRQTNFSIQKIQFTMGSSVGENYCSQIYRVKVEFRSTAEDGAECRTLSVIIKSLPPSKATQFVEDLEMFLKEKITYSDVLPRMEMLLEGGDKFGARLYHSLKEPVNTLVFEDLNTRKFEMASRETGLDEEHSRLVMRRLAQFHATSMILAKKDPEILKCYNNGMLAKSALDIEDGTFIKYFTGCAEALIALVSQWQGYEKITEKIRAYRANIRENLIKTQASQPGELKVLNHGDLWVNNILFKYENGKRRLQDVIFVDFQLSIWGSPGIDLNYFFYTSVQLDILKNKREELIKFYYNELSSTLRRLNFAEVPSYQQLREEVRRREPFGFFANYSIYPTISMDKEESKNNSLDNFEDPDFAREKLKKAFSSKRLEDTLRYTLKKFDEMGVFD